VSRHPPTEEGPVTARLDQSSVPVGLFRPMPPARTSAAIVSQLRALIRGGQLPIGSRLPPERELCEQLGVSRLSLREALRVLESTGLIEIRLGARGGAFVTAPTAPTAGQGITDLLSTSGLSAVNVTEARILFELGVVLPLVSERATQADLRELRALCDEEERARNQGTYDVAVSFGFHQRLAVASHNPAVSMIIESFREAILMSMREARHEGNQGAAEHRAFVDAVESGDGESARRIMADHLQRTADAVAGR
jgi:GntR family transcriptional regulator, transcriptional repressor for pyruvate dehydrogenase complex